MATKPATLCELAKDKLLSTFQGFVETFNWIKDFCSEEAVVKIEAGDDSNIEVEEETDDETGGKVIKINVYYK